MPIHRRQRKILLFLGSALAGGLLLLLALPVWFPWLLRPLSAKQGAGYSRYERIGAGRFAVYDLSVTNDGVRLRVQRLEAFLPIVWLWHGKLRPRAERLPFLALRGWQLEFLPAPGGHAATNEPAVYGEFMDVDAVLEKLRDWLPLATFSDGHVLLGKAVFNFPSLIWTRSNLTAAVEWPAQAQRATLKLNSDSRHSYQLNLSSDSLGLESTTRLAAVATVVNVQSSNVWRSNPFELEAQFGRHGLWPQTAKVRAPNFHLPQEVTRLKEFRDVTGSAAADWQAGHFDLQLEAAASPKAEQNNLPPIQVQLRAHGDTNAATIQSATVSAPWLQAQLSQDLNFHFRGRLLDSPAHFRLSADLERQPWLPLKGTLKGEAQLTPSEGKFPRATFAFSGSDLGASRVSIASLSLAGHLDWPSLEVTSLEVKPEADSGASLSGTMDLEKTTITDAHFEFRGPWARQFLPQQYSYQDLSLAGNLHGPIKSLVYSAHLEVTNLIARKLRPLLVRTDLNGEALQKVQATLEVSTGRSKISMDAALQVEAMATNILVRSLTLQTNETSILELTQPFHVSVSRPAIPEAFALSVDPFEWRGTGGRVRARLALDWPYRGTGAFSVENLSWANFADFSKTNFGDFHIRNLEATAGWTNGPATFRLELEGTGATREGLGLSVVSFMSGNQHGLAISNLLVSSGTSAVASAIGFLPVTIEPGRATNLLVLDRQTPLQLAVTTDPTSTAWNSLPEYTGLTLVEPDLRLNLAGNWSKPYGEVRLDARRLVPRATGTNIPTLENLHVRLALDREHARLTDGQVKVQGQPVLLTGELPLGENFWRELTKKPLPNWERASARLRAENVKLASFSGLVPSVLSPQGEASLDLSLLPGFNFDGGLSVHQARTRPLSTIGPLRDIDLKLTCHGRTLSLEQASARMGTAPVTLHGQADLRGTNWLAETLPPLELTVRGTNVPLSRQPDSLIRSDLNLAITKTNGAPPLISGEARLRDSFYLSDLSELVRGGVTQPSRRPPYFSLTDPPLADWRMAVHVTGSRFLKVRSTLFNGEVSANLNLQGTLKEPLLLGDVKIDSGSVNFPFASLQVQQGLVTLNSANPYRPNLSMSATSKQFGYDIRLEVSGFADAPVIQFTSNPPLSSEQILMMVTAGNLPGGTYSLTPQQRAQTMALFLGRDLLTKLGLGEQTEQRLIIHSGQEISEVGRPTYDVEYKIAPRWSVVGEYDRFGDFNAGFKWQIYAK